MTSKKHHIKLNLSEHFKNSVSSRAAVINLFTIDLSDIKILEINFSDIDFVSRSATHQLIKEKERLENKLHIKVNFSSVNNAVKEMFAIVNKSIESPPTKVSEIHRIHFSTQKEFSNFLSRI